MKRELEEARRDFERSIQALVSNEENADTTKFNTPDKQPELVSQMLAFLDKWLSEFGPPFS